VASRLALRCIDVVLPTFLAPYLMGIWLLWGDGLLLAGACTEPELTALGRWLCLGWLPCLAAALAATGWSATRGRLAPLPPALKTAIPVVFLASVPFWLYATHAAVRGLGAELSCETPLRCSFSRPAPAAERAADAKTRAGRYPAAASPTGAPSEPGASAAPPPGPPAPSPDPRGHADIADARTGSVDTPAQHPDPSKNGDVANARANWMEEPLQSSTTAAISRTASAQIAANAGDNGRGTGDEGPRQLAGGSGRDAPQPSPASSAPADDLAQAGASFAAPSTTSRAGAADPSPAAAEPASPPSASQAAPADPGAAEAAPASPGPASSGRPEPSGTRPAGALVDGTAFHPNGRIRCSGAYRTVGGERVETGAWTTWSATGQKLSEGRYTEGRREGPWRDWHENGQPKRVATYREGRPQADLAEWHADGSVALQRNELRTDDGRVLWVEERFHPGGRRAARHQYENGVREGPAGEWDETGRPVAAGGYVSGERDGLWILWDASGNGRTERYEAGASPASVQP
jgi:antitoxin component YwqK of YwqJK toxin-antitoxin module